ncbi:MAG: efflux RND transporter periplasmic adaptor subunit [Phycisphaerales bacterium]|nr:efflux RND transporter periplasmic adaptor subunit [Phycisphaerales bacterium]MCB9836286.1 efflux RND transporter periplasmic adaptor subunit [Phycisphaera sp.]
MTNRNRWICLAALTTCLVLMLGLGAMLPQPERSYTGVSRPFTTRELAFAVRGKIAAVMVEPGDRVETGQELMRLDDSVQQATLELAKAQLQDDTRLELAQIALEFKSEELRLVEDSLKNGGANEQDVRTARFELARAKVELRAAESEMLQRGLTEKREQARLDEMRIVCPIDGDVVRVDRREGETVDEQTSVITVVQVEPLRIDVSVPVPVSRRLQIGQAANVSWLDIETQEPAVGKVIFISRAGEASVREVLVRIEVPNADGLPSGMHARVSFQGE